MNYKTPFVTGWKFIEAPELCIVCFTILLFATCCINQSGDWLKSGFKSPPDNARPGVYWYFIDGNLDREQMTADLESMKKAGIGYALFMEVNQRIPRGNVDFLSPEWQELFKHAVREGERLGIRIALGTGPGWTGSGGPWVKPEQSMQFLVTSSTEVKGPSVFNGRLTRPDPKTPYSTPEDLPESVKNLRDSWYEDVVTLAFPTPRVSKLVDNIDDKALYYRGWYSSQAWVLPFLQAPADFTETPGAAIDPQRIINLTEKLHPDGSLNWNVPPGKWTIIRFGRRNNGILTRPAPVPGLGMECDKLDTNSLNAHFQSYILKLIETVKPRKVSSGGGWTMLHIDSWEIGTQNWTMNFREEFRRRRGYDLTPFLPAYTGRIVGSLEQTERFLWDVRLTAKEMVVEYHARHIRKLGHKKGLELTIQPYDQNPSADLELGGEADVPMCEFWSDGTCFQTTYSSIEATSIAHTLGKPVVAAESFTACDDEAWKNYPGMMKNQGDWAFAMGINRLYYHTFVHKVHGDTYPPGITLGSWGLHWDRCQTWWPMISDYNLYISRCQYILSQGKPVAEVLYLTPEGAPNAFRSPVSATEGTKVLSDKKGYSFDGCSPVHLMARASVKDHRIVFPGGASYSLLVLPLFETMTPGLITKIESLVNAGAMVVGPPPVKSPSLTNYPACDEQVCNMARKMWGTHESFHDRTERHYGLGKLIWGGELMVRDSGEHYPSYVLTSGILDKEGIKPDFTSDGSVRYIHRSLPDREIYFVSNRTGNPVEETCVFRDGTLKAELWDALTGEIRPLNNLKKKSGGIAIPVRFDTYQSFFVVFYPTKKNTVSKALAQTDFPEIQELMTLEGPWNVSFDPKWGGPEQIIFDSLTDWSRHPEERVRYYSGTVVYSQTFDLKDGIDRDKQKRLFLNLGIVKNMARVMLNEQDLGVVWTAPWQAEITHELKNKDNKLRIEVANLWPNRLIGDELEPDDGVKNGKWPDWLLNGTERPSKRYTFTTFRYYKKNDPLLESGLLGPVRVIGISED